MFTLRGALKTINGLYRDCDTGQNYSPRELLADLPASLLDSPVRLERMGRGTYRISVADNNRVRYDLFSRRRARRVV